MTAVRDRVSGVRFQDKAQEKAMRKAFVVLALGAMFFALCSTASAQQSKPYRIGVLVPGEAWYEIIDGLRIGLKQLGLEEGKQFNLSIRDWQGNAKTAEETAKKFEQEKVNLIYATSTNSAIMARRVTAEIPIIFCAGTDPVVVGLVDSFANPGGRLTGVYHPITDLAPKRLEILKEIVPKLRRVVTFYDPRRPTGIESSKLAREAARQMGLQLIERHVGSGKELQAGVRALRAGEVDAYLAVSDPIASNEAQFIIEMAKVKRLPTMFEHLSHVPMGGLASYAVSFHEMGRLSAKYVQRILTGVKPQDLPVEGVDKIELVINLKTAKEIGLTVPPNVLYRADRIIKQQRARRKGEEQKQRGTNLINESGQSYQVISNFEFRIERENNGTSSN
jgi:putative tryptophan/tyrosine transport system substrate-binding protein